MKPEMKDKVKVTKEKLIPKGLCTQCGDRVGRYLIVPKEYGRRMTIGAEWLCEKCFPVRITNKSSREHKG